ncbi:hypothetical protein [Elioraea sp.]|uniref:hypothetical protein n=1 Tax=Elioraea sp. TaxID=2185103 RepID=UPI0025C308F2|nr:hypothetical protein [Elioraea sp.]
MPDGHQDKLSTRPAPMPQGDMRHALQLLQIDRALVDVGLLRTFVSGHNDASLERALADRTLADRTLADRASATQAAAPLKEAFLRRIAEIEQMDIAAIGRDPDASAFLFCARDTLNAAAAPADAYTIAFTGFYTGGLPEAAVLRHRSDFAEMHRQARVSKAVTSVLAIAGIAAVMLAVSLSVHAMVGKTVLDQVRATGAALAAIEKDVAAADTAAISAIDPKPGLWTAIVPRLCDRVALLPGPGTPPERMLYGFEGPAHWLLCDTRREALFRHNVAKSELATWIDRTTGVATVKATGAAKGGTAVADPIALANFQPAGADANGEPERVYNGSWISWLPGLSVRDISQHTSYTSEQVGGALLSALGIYYLPVLFGVLGGAVYAVRRLNNKIVSSELHPRDWRHALFRIFMAFLLGGCIGLFFRAEGTTVDGPAGTVALSIAALAFLAGYSVEVVFRFFDLVIAQALRVVTAIAPAGGGVPGQAAAGHPRGA